MGKTIKETIHANGYDISIYTSDFENEFISLTDIAFEFASWVSAEFKLYIIKDYKRLKNDENSRLSLIYSCLYRYADRWLFAGSTENQNESILAALIRRIIQNPVYCGKISYDRRRTEKVHGTRNEYRQV